MQRDVTTAIHRRLNRLYVLHRVARGDDHDRVLSSIGIAPEHPEEDQNPKREYCPEAAARGRGYTGRAADGRCIESGKDFRSGSRSLRRTLRQALHNECGNANRHGGSDLVQWTRYLVCMRGDELARARSLFERVTAGEELIRDHAPRVQVSAGVHDRPLHALLGRHIRGRPD